MGNVFWSDSAMMMEGRYPSILAIGDSWFWYPFPGGSLLNQLGKLVETKEHVIFALGENGAEIVDYVAGKHSKLIRKALKLHGPSLSAAFISGGGNDFAGVNDLRPMLNINCSTAKTPDDCFRPGTDDRTLEWLMRKTAENYEILIGQIMAATGPDVPIVLHNYDYALPTGKGVFGKESTWLRMALDDATVPLALQAGCVRLVIDRLTAELVKLTQIDPTRILLVDSRGCLEPNQWANEIHPKPAGFKKIAVTRWTPVLQSLSLAA
ncbi:hypothetical protein JAB1_14390 [Janthinobacterium sp. MP5059B]|uniref:SGNH/GDSL hydrolase family protein n=1 Tax=Janthinobacterium sp. MP5059B TaxID=1766683 RepID=UPI0008738B64|nr:SGNH/GDSL hydrolase family protein [Janthinobacterium sp. MP5059B]OEZ50324.1 hypothetical protein JAB1_14390 [Janthinobacterium sp. MP5059B]